jgi:integrase
MRSPKHYDVDLMKIHVVPWKTGYKAYRNFKGKRFEASAKTEKEAIAKCRAKLSSFLAPMSEASAGYCTTVIDIAETLWVPTLISKKSRTQHGYKTDFTRYVSPTIGQMRYEDVRPVDVQNWYNGLLKKVSPATANKALVVLRGVFRVARRNRLIEYNPCEEIETIDGKNKRDYYMSGEGVGLMLNRLEMGGYPELALVAFFGVQFGERRGEIWELKLSDIDTETWVMGITRARGKDGVIGDPKGGKRWVAFPESRYEYVLRLMEKTSAIDNKEGYICTNHGRTWTATRLSDRIKEAKADGVWPADLVLHGARHIFNNLALQSSRASAMKALGHKSEQVNNQYTSMNAALTVPAIDEVASRIGVL